MSYSYAIAYFAETKVQVSCKNCHVTCLEWQLQLPDMLHIKSFPPCLLMTHLPGYHI